MTKNFQNNDYNKYIYKKVKLRRETLGTTILKNCKRTGTGTGTGTWTKVETGRGTEAVTATGTGTGTRTGSGTGPWTGTRTLTGTGTGTGTETDKDLGQWILGSSVMLRLRNIPRSLTIIRVKKQ